MTARRSKEMATLGALLSLASSPIAAFPPGPLVTKEQAKSLAFEALTPKEKKLGAGFEARSDERYFYITVIPSSGEGMLNVAVDRRTGDVWTTSACFERTNRRLRKLQVRIREQLRLTPSTYAKLKGHGPFCDS